MGNFFFVEINNGAEKKELHFKKKTNFFFKNGTPPPPPKKKCFLNRKINKHTINDFLNKLNYETWDTIFSTNDVNKMFNSFFGFLLENFLFQFSTKKSSH